VPGVGSTVETSLGENQVKGQIALATSTEKKNAVMFFTLHQNIKFTYLIHQIFKSHIIHINLHQMHIHIMFKIEVKL